MRQNVAGNTTWSYVNSPNCRASICRRVRHFADCLQ